MITNIYLFFGHFLLTFFIIIYTIIIYMPSNVIVKGGTKFMCGGSNPQSGSPQQQPQQPQPQGIMPIPMGGIFFPNQPNPNPQPPQPPQPQPPQNPQQGGGYGGYGHCFMRGAGHCMRGGSINDQLTQQEENINNQAFVNTIVIRNISVNNLRPAINQFTNNPLLRDALLNLFKRFTLDYLEWLNLPQDVRQNYNIGNLYSSYRQITSQFIRDEVFTYMENNNFPQNFGMQDAEQAYYFSIGYFRIMTNPIQEGDPPFNAIAALVAPIQGFEFDEDDTVNLLPLLSVQQNVINNQQAINVGTAMHQNPDFGDDGLDDNFNPVLPLQ